MRWNASTVIKLRYFPIHQCNRYECGILLPPLSECPSFDYVNSIGFDNSVVELSPGKQEVVSSNLTRFLQCLKYFYQQIIQACQKR